MNTASECLIMCNLYLMFKLTLDLTRTPHPPNANAYDESVGLQQFNILGFLPESLHYRPQCSHCLSTCLVRENVFSGHGTISQLVTSVVFVNRGVSCQILPVPRGPFCVWAHYVCNVCPHLTSPLWLGSVHAPMQLSHFTLPLLHYHLE